MYSIDLQSYNSFSDEAAMRVSGCGFVANSPEETQELSNAVFLL